MISNDILIFCCFLIDWDPTQHSSENDGYRWIQQLMDTDADTHSLTLNSENPREEREEELMGTITPQENPEKQLNCAQGDSQKLN